MSRYISAFLITVTLLFSCQSTGKTPSAVPARTGAAIHYSLIYIVHGDADYSYHQDGTLRRADKKVLAEAKSAGESSANGEVFVFHLSPRTGIIPPLSRNHRHLDYYRNGKLLLSTGYTPDIRQGSFSAEADLFKKFSPAEGGRELKKVLLYFGHEIPPRGGRGYHRSYPDAAFNYRTFVTGVDRFLNGTDADQFDLMMISTCNNGTPAMANLLQSRTRYLLASPQNLHLSHMDTHPLTLLDNDSLSVHAVAEISAEVTFQRLSESVQTAVTISLYDMKNIDGYIAQFSEKYRSYLSRSSFTVGDDNVDCASLPLFEPDRYSTGVQHWYRPPRFGQSKDITSHSGWGCQQSD